MPSVTVKKRITKNPPEIDINNLPLLLTEAQAAKLMGVSISYLRKSRCEGAKKSVGMFSREGNIYDNPAPPFVRINKNTIRYRTADVLAWVNNLKLRAVI